MGAIMVDETTTLDRTAAEATKCERGGGGSQESSQAETKKPWLQHHMGLKARNTDFVACK